MNRATHHTEIALRRSISADPVVYLDPTTSHECEADEPGALRGTARSVERYGVEWRMVVDVGGEMTIFVRPLPWRTSCE